MRSLTDQECYDVLTTSTEGGSGYWALVLDWKRAEDLSWTEVTMVEEEEFRAIEHELDLPAETATDLIERIEAQDVKVFVVTADKVRAAANALYEAQAIRSDLLAQMTEGYEGVGDFGGVDADVADCIVQWACFGEVVYG